MCHAFGHWAIIVLNTIENTTPEAAPQVTAKPRTPAVERAPMDVWIECEAS